MSLVEVTKDTRIILKIGLALGVLGVFIFLIFKGGQIFRNTFFPAPPAPAEQKFGILPPIEFPANTNSGYEYRIETISGFLPTFPTTISVYKLKKNEPTIAALPDAKIRAGNLGFTENEQALSTSEYRWTNTELDTTLSYEIYDLNFSVSSNYLRAPEFLPADTLDIKRINTTINSFISTLGNNMEDIEHEKTQYEYYFASPEGIQPAASPENASVVKVNLFQKPINELPIYYPEQNGSALYFMVSLIGRNPEVMEASYHHFVPNLSDGSTYYLKTAQEAFDELANGGGYVVSPTENKSVAITDVVMGYYLNNNDNQQYLLPIIVFMGLDNFVAYIPAVKN